MLTEKSRISNTMIEEIQEFAFVHCTSLCDIDLLTTLHTIRVKAFMNCAALPELAIPPSLRSVASRAFLVHCTPETGQCDTDVRRRGTATKAFRNFLLQIHGNMDCQWNVSEWTLFKALLRGKKFTAIAKHYRAFRALLQLFPDWIVQIGLRVCLQEVNHTPENLEVRHEGKMVHHMIFEVLKAIKFGNAQGDVNDCAER